MFTSPPRVVSSSSVLRWTNRAHANVYLPLLGEKNHVKNLLKGFPAGTKFAEVYPYRKLAQPASIQGGTMKDYQVRFWGLVTEGGGGVGGGGR